ncbi:MAG: hypothetical protein ACXVIP_00005 [Halobacteriota archaeon]
MPILQVSPQLPNNLQISQNTGILIVLGLAVLVIIIAIALVVRARRRALPETEAEQPSTMQANETQRFEEESEEYREIGTPIPVAEESHPIYSAEPDVESERDQSERALEEPMDYSTLEFPQKTTKIIKGNVNVAAVMASPDKAGDIHNELSSLGYESAITPSEAVIDKDHLAAKIAEVRDDLDSNETLSVILLKCIDIARSLNRRSDLNWLEREAFGSEEWDDSIYLDVSEESVFPTYRLLNAAMYLNYTREGDEFPTIEEYSIPVFENRPIYALEKVIEAANIENQDYVVLNTPAPAEWPTTASLGELIPLTMPLQGYLNILNVVKTQMYDFINSV